MYHFALSTVAETSVGSSVNAKTLAHRDLVRLLERLLDRLVPMDATDQEATVVSDLADLDHVRLADLQVMTDETVSGMLRRIVPATPGRRVSVAAFNSSV